MPFLTQKKTMGNLILGRISAPEGSRLLQDRRAPLMLYWWDRVSPLYLLFKSFRFRRQFGSIFLLGTGGLLTALPLLRTALPPPLIPISASFNQDVFCGSATGLIIEAKAIPRRGAVRGFHSGLNPPPQNTRAGGSVIGTDLF